MKAFNQILKMMSVAAVLALSVVGCGKSDGGNSNLQASYALVNNVCTDIRNHVIAPNPNSCGYNSASYSWQGNQCVASTGQVVSSSVCQASSGGQCGTNYNSQYGNGGYNQTCGGGGYPNPGGYPQTGGYQWNANSCVGTYMYFNGAYEQRGYCNGQNCAGYQMYDMQGRLTNCQ